MPPRITLPKSPSRKQLETFALNLTDEYLYCRRYGHSWHPRSATKLKHWYEATVYCTRCTAERVEVISLNGEVLRRSMRYPTGYLAVGIGRIIGDSKNYLRIEAIERHMAGVEQELEQMTEETP